MKEKQARNPQIAVTPETKAELEALWQGKDDTFDKIIKRLLLREMGRCQKKQG